MERKIYKGFVKGSAVLSLVLLFMIFLIPGPAYCGDKKHDGETGKKSLQSRIDFGNSYIMGQTIKSGAVYLMQRKKSRIRSMLSCRKDYRKEILEDFIYKGGEAAGQTTELTTRPESRSK